MNRLNRYSRPMLYEGKGMGSIKSRSVVRDESIGAMLVKISIFANLGCTIASRPGRLVARVRGRCQAGTGIIPDRHDEGPDISYSRMSDSKCLCGTGAGECPCFGFNSPLPVFNMS